MSASACIFCRIAAGEIPAQIVARDEGVIAFRDVNPQAPAHLLVIPTDHIASVNDLGPAHAELVGRMTLLAQKVAREQGFADDGFRLVMNCGRHGGQTVWHIHLHVLGGRHLAWPPG